MFHLLELKGVEEVWWLAKKGEEEGEETERKKVPWANPDSSTLVICALQSQRTEFRGLRIPDDQDEDDDEGPFGDSPLAVELMARMLTLFGRDGDPNTGPDPFLASIIFRVGEDCFPNNHLLRLYGLVYEWTFRACVSEPIPTELLETVSELLIESAASLPVDARFILFSFSQQYKTDDMRQQELALRCVLLLQCVPPVVDDGFWIPLLFLKW